MLSDPGLREVEALTLKLPYHSDPDILGGTPVFVGTRVPVSTLMEYLEAGDPLDEFLEDFPSVERSQAVASRTSVPQGSP
ncbi:MAG: DUF433 domain-containing protein [Acidobacteriota bacterium]